MSRLSFDEKVAAARAALEAPSWSDLPIDELAEHMSVLHVNNQQHKTASLKLAADEAKPGWISAVTGLMQKYPALAGALLGSSAGAIGTALNPDEDERDYLTSLLYGGAAGGLAGLGYGLYNDPSTLKNLIKEKAVKLIDPEAASPTPVDYSNTLQKITSNPNASRSGELARGLASSPEFTVTHPEFTQAAKDYAALTGGGTASDTTPEQIESWRRMLSGSSLLGRLGITPPGGEAAGLANVPQNSALGDTYQLGSLASQVLGLGGYLRDGVSALAQLRNPDYMLHAGGAVRKGLGRVADLPDKPGKGTGAAAGPIAGNYGLTKEQKEYAAKLVSSRNTPVDQVFDLGAKGLDVGNMTADDLKKINEAAAAAATGQPAARPGAKNKWVEAGKTLLGYNATNTIDRDVSDIFGLNSAKMYQAPPQSQLQEAFGSRYNVADNKAIYQSYPKGDPAFQTKAQDAFKSSQPQSKDIDVDTLLKPKTMPVRNLLGLGKDITNSYAGRTKARARAAMTFGPEIINQLGAGVESTRSNNYLQRRNNALQRMQDAAKNIPQLQPPAVAP